MVIENSLNTNRVLRTIWENHEISRTLIADHLEVNRSTITKITAPLLEENLLILDEKGESTPNGGRRPINLSLNTRYGVILGIEIQTERWNLVITDVYGSILLNQSHELDLDLRDFSTALAEIVRRAENASRDLHIPVIGAGIGMSGLVNPYNGHIYQSNPLGISQEQDLYTVLSRSFPYPIIIENDANCCCYSELIQKKAYRARNFLSVLGEFRKSQSSDSPGTMGIAIGTGVVIKGSVLHGDTFSAGEFQSVFKNQTNPSQFNLGPDELARLTADSEILRRVMNELSRNIAFLVNMMNFTLINFEGDIVHYRHLLEEFLQLEIQINWSYNNQVQCQINFGDPDANAVAHGAAGVVLEKMFAAPIIPEPSDFYPSGIDLIRYARSRRGVAESYSR